VRTRIDVMGYIAFPAGAASPSMERQFADDARALQEGGCFSILMSNAPDDLAARITRDSTAITISLNSGNRCHGQMTITYEMLGLSATSRWFAPPYARLYPQMREAVRRVLVDAQKRTVPMPPR
jgi:3-methyl-2-oxobutanoate hydroxymethyltransferase